MNKRRFKKGMTLIELIISLALLAIIIVPISAYALGSIKNSLESEKNQRASFMGQRFLEEIKAYDEIILKTSEEGKRYFEILDGEILEEVSLNNFQGEMKKDNLKLEMEIKEDTEFKDNKINNLENITGETFTLNLRESIKVPSIEIKENLNQIKDFNNDLVVTLEENLKIKVNDSLNQEELVSYLSYNNLKNIIVIYIDESFSLNKTIEIRNKTKETMNVYVVKNNNSTGKVKVFGSEGSVFINDEIDLFEKSIDGKRFNYSVKVKDKNNHIIFEGASSSNLNLK